MFSSLSSKLKEEFLKLLREDIEFRYAVAGLLGLEEILRRIDVNTQAIKELQREVAEHSKAIRDLQQQTRSLQEQVKSLQEQVKLMQEELAKHSRVLMEHSKALRELTSAIQSIGLRYGIFTEEAFRESIKYLVEDLLKSYEVKKWRWFDQEGIVYGYPSIVEVDVFIKGQEHILVKFDEYVDKSDVAELLLIGKLYEKVIGVKPKLLLVAGAIRRRAKEFADEVGIEIRGHVLEL